MSDAVIIYPHQLFADSPALAAVTKHTPVYLVEEPLLLTHNPIHRQKLIFHKLSMDAYEHHLRDQGYPVNRVTIHDCVHTSDVFARLKNNGVKTMHIIDTTDDYLERAIAHSGIERIWYESPLFLLTKHDALHRYVASKRFMASFYKQLRKDWTLLLNEDGTPLGGKWSFDDENRKKLPGDVTIPDDLAFFSNVQTIDATSWARTVPGEQYGEAGCWLPYTQAGAEKFLKEFLRTRFQYFGPYEDAMTTKHTRLYHSTLSPLLNVGLLTPRHVLETTLAYAKTHHIPLNSLEGFVRQLIGWREFIRASYEYDGRAMRTKNFWQHTRTLSKHWWDGTTGLLPVDHVITSAHKYAYTHHIERLMIMGNAMLLCQLHPHEAYRWFMGMYIDAYDWVMVPNVYGMSQFADGGSFATKPYISGAHYIKKMSDYPKGTWESTWTALYWHFIDTHKDFFARNHRLSMMPTLLNRMKPETREMHLQTARHYLQKRQ